MCTLSICSFTIYSLASLPTRSAGCQPPRRVRGLPGIDAVTIQYQDDTLSAADGGLRNMGVESGGGDACRQKSARSIPKNCFLYVHTSLSARVVGNLRRPPKTCHSSSESWENGDSEYVIRYAGKIRPFLKFQYLCNIRNYFFWPDLRRLPSQQTPNIWYVLVANMLESNPVVRNISEIHLRLHKLRCIPILTLHI